MEGKTSRIIIADDHAVVRTGLQLILDETTDLEISEEARDGDELIEKLKLQQFDLVIMDVSMPGKDAMNALLEINVSWPDLPVVIFSMNPDELYAIRMIKNGAHAYINKETKPKQIIEVLRTVLNGKKYFFPNQLLLLGEMVSNPESTKALPHHLLTDRESQIFSMLASGIRKTEIAEKLGISKNTIGNHRNNIMKKLNMSLNSELTRYALRHGIIH